MMTFFFIFCSFLTLIYIYTGLRLIPAAGNKKAARICWCLLITVMLTLFVHLYLRINFIHPALSRICAWIGYGGLGLVSYLFCMVFIRDLILLPPLWFKKISRRITGSGSGTGSEPGSREEFKVQRRSFLLKASGYSIAALGTGAAGIGCAGALQPPRVVNIKIPLKQAHKGLSGLKMIQLTDLHVGPTIGYEYVKTVCRAINGQAPDIVVFTGDLADGSPHALARDVEPLKTIRAPLGKYFTTGNHEYYSGVDQWIQKTGELGFIPLMNEHRVIQYGQGELTLAGVTDIRAKYFSKSHASSPQKAIHGCPENSFKLLCAHQPTTVYQAAQTGFDLQVSGHTHGGQYFPFNYFILLEHPFVKGMYQHQGTQLYVSQGTGYWGPPIRIGTFPEITLFQFI